MTMRRSLRVVPGFLALLLAGVTFGCNPAVTTDVDSEPPADPGPDPDPGPEPAEFPTCGALPACDDSIHVAADSSALMITDPQVLAKVPLRRVVEQLLTSSKAPYSPEEAMARFFDTMNATEYGQFDDVVHCDHVDPELLISTNEDTFTCPRAEGTLASSQGLFVDGHPDSFIPVAIVNRFDLTPINAMRCGQYRIVYAKRSGLTDPKNRVFLIFEPSLANPAVCLEACRPIAQDWAALQGKGTEEIGQFVEALFFEGVHGFAPVIHPSSFGVDREDTQGYTGGFDDGDEGGQIRVSMHMEDPWAMHELRFRESPLTGGFDFVPTTVKNNPTAALFEPQNSTEAAGAAWSMLLNSSLPTLARADLPSIQIFTPRAINGFESMLGGAKKNDYHSAATSGGDMTYIQYLDESLVKVAAGIDCPPGDPLDAEAILDRATTQSCAGCHAPSELIGEDRSIGCGLTWPDSIGQVHVTEKSELSPALTDVFLPHRAKVLETYLQACDIDAMFGNFQSGIPEDGFKKVLPGATLGGGGTH